MYNGYGIDRPTSPQLPVVNPVGRSWGRTRSTSENRREERPRTGRDDTGMGPVTIERGNDPYTSHVPSHRPEADMLSGEALTTPASPLSHQRPRTRQGHPKTDRSGIHHRPGDVGSA